MSVICVEVKNREFHRIQAYCHGDRSSIHIQEHRENLPCKEYFHMETKS